MPNNQNLPVFDPNSNPTPINGMTWSDIWSDWAWRSQENNMWSTSGEIQFSEWSQQMVATMYQNWYNSAPEQMRRAMEAGINPFIAASGIVGSDVNQVAPAPPSTPAGSPALSALGNVASAAGGLFGNIASGTSMFAKLLPEIRKIDTETASLFEGLGFTHLQSVALSTQLKYMDQKEQIGVWQALANFDKTKQEYQNLKALHENILAQHEEIIAHKDLLVQEKGEVAAREEYEKAMKGLVDEQAKWQTMENEFFNVHGYKIGTPIYESIRDMMISDGTFNMDEFGNIVAGYEGKIMNAVEGVKAEKSWDYRPSTVYEAAAYVGYHVGTALRDLILNANDVKTWSDLANKLKSDSAASREFEESFKDSREELYENYLSKKRYYRHIKRGGNTAEVARAKMAMDNAYNEYVLMTKEKFANELIKSISPK